MGVRVFFAFALLATAALAQGDEPKSPRDLFVAFFRLTDAYNEGDVGALVRAGQLFDLSDVLAADREEAARQAARNLRNFLDRVVVVDYYLVPGPGFQEKGWTFRTTDGELHLDRTDEGVWRFSKQTLTGIADLFDKVRDRPLLGESAGIEDDATWLRQQMPAWLLNRLFLLEHWQWLGLLALVLAGFVAGAALRLVMTGIGRRLARRRGAAIDEQPRRGRPFAMVGMALLWLALFRFLDLPFRAYTALMIAARLVLMVGVVWSTCRVVDWISEVFQSLAHRTESRLDDLLVPMVRKALKVFIIAFGVVWIADNLDMDIAALLAGLGIGGVAIALASKDTVENFFGAISILGDRPFQVGDWIKMGNIEGTVEEVGFRSTRVRTFYNSLTTFPNAMLIRTAVDNLGSRQYRRIKETIGVTYDTPPDKLLAFVEGIRELIRVHPYTRKDYYHVYFNSFGDSALNVLVYLFLHCPDWATELRERQRLMLDILRLAGRLGVEFAFPTQTLHLIRGTSPDHDSEPRAVAEAHGLGRAEATSIVDEFTGQAVPPPVVIGKRPDDDAGDDDGGGGGE